MTSRWMVCAFALLLGCSGSENGGDGGGGTAGAGGTAGSAGSGGTTGSGGTAGDGGTGGMDLCEGVDCTSANDCVQDGTCDPANGSCDPGDNEPADTACTDGGTVCDGSGNCVECNNAADCTEAAQCLVSTCVQNTCGQEAGPDGAECDLLGVGDGLCDNGECVEPPPCIIASDCPDIECSVKDCALGACTYSPTDGASCEVEPGLPGTCDGSVCVGLCEGAECRSLNDCVMDGTCNAQTGQCIPGDPLDPGETCDLLGIGDGVCTGSGNCVECLSDDDCSGDEVCNSNICMRDVTCMASEIFREDFESGIGTWSADNGVWEVGTPASFDCSGGAQCAGTGLDGHYPEGTDSRLRSRTIVLPELCNGDELHLRFWQRFQYNSGDSGQVQVSVRDSGGGFGAWVSEGSPVSGGSGGWSLKDVDLSAYAGQTVRIGFYHAAAQGGAVNPSGWTIDDIQIVAKAPAFTADFENGWGDWFADNGVWQVGTPTSFDCSEGVQCAGTGLEGHYPEGTDSRLIGAPIVLPEVTGIEELHLRFWQRFQYNSGDSGQVQVSVRDPGGGFGAWVSEGSPVSGGSGGWSLKDVDLSAYAGQTVRIGFYHAATQGGAVNPSGWTIDDIQIVAKAPAFTADFENGWGDWFADNGVWQVGTPTSFDCSEGVQCAGTGLEGHYPEGTDSRLIGAPIVLPEVTGIEELHLRFWQRFQYNSGDSGQVQVSVRDPGGGFGAWVSEGSPVSGGSGGWSLKDVDLSAYAGQTVRIGFYHAATQGGAVNPSGWTIDDIQILTF